MKIVDKVIEYIERLNEENIEFIEDLIEPHKDYNIADAANAIGTDEINDYLYKY